MIATLALVAALTAQAPSPAPKPDGKAQAAKLIAKRKAKRTASYVARANRDEADRQAAMAQAKADQELAIRVAPLQLQAQQNAIYGQSVANQAAFQQRLAGAMERQAGYVYPGQSPSTGPYPGPPNVLPVNPLYAPLIP